MNRRFLFNTFILSLYLSLFLAFTSFSSDFKNPSYELALANRFTVIENVLYLNSGMVQGDILFITDLKGKNIFGYVHEVDISKIKLPAIARGMYTVTQVRNHKVVHSNQVAIGLTR